MVMIAMTISTTTIVTSLMSIHFISQVTSRMTSRMTSLSVLLAGPMTRTNQESVDHSDVELGYGFYDEFGNTGLIKSLMSLMMSPMTSHTISRN